MLAIGETVSKLSLALLNDFKSKVRDDTQSAGLWRGRDARSTDRDWARASTAPPGLGAEGERRAPPAQRPPAPAPPRRVPQTL